MASRCPYCVVRDSAIDGGPCEDCGRYKAYWDALTEDGRQAERDMIVRYAEESEHLGL